MEKHIIDERTGWEYELHGDYYYPTGRVMRNGVMTPGELPEDNDPEEEIPVGVWGMRHKAFLKENRRAFYSLKIAEGAFQRYLAEIDRQAEDMFLRLVNEMAAQEGVTEQLKAEDQMEWVRRMNGISQVTTEIVNHELIYN